MTERQVHHYTSNVGSPGARHLTCACGHAEPFDGDADFGAACERMNAHIRSTCTDEEWEKRMRRSKIATFDAATGALKMSAEGDKS